MGDLHHRRNSPNSPTSLWKSQRLDRGGRGHAAECPVDRLALIRNCVAYVLFKIQESDRGKLKHKQLIGSRFEEGEASHE
jgi:hypothetical protein